MGVWQFTVERFRSLGRRPWTIGILVITVCAAGLRVAYLDQPIRYDEACTYLVYARRSWWNAISNYSSPNNHVLHTLLVRAITELLGNREWTIRLPALLAGIATIPVAYRAISTLYDRRVGLIAAALLAVSVPQIDFSTNGRGYTMAVLGFMVIAAVAGKILEDDGGGQRRDWVGISVVSALGLFTIPIFVYPLCATFAWLVLNGLLPNIHFEPQRRRLLLRTAAAGAAIAAMTALLYAPIIATSGFDSLTSNAWVLRDGGEKFWQHLSSSLLQTWRELHAGLPKHAAWTMAALALLGCALPPPRRDSSSMRNRVSLVIVSVTCGAAITIGRRVVPFPRVWLWFMPLYFVAVARGAVLLIDVIVARSSSRWRDALPWAIAVTTTVMLTIALPLTSAVPRFDEAGKLRGANDAARAIYSAFRPGDALAPGVISDFPVAYHLIRMRLRGARHTYRHAYEAQRVFVVYNVPRESLAYVMDYRKLELADFDAPRRIWTSPDLHVDLLIRRTPASTRPNDADESPLEMP